MEQLATGYGFLEAPVWDAASGCLLFADPALGGVWCLSGDGTVDCPYPHRRGIGGMALHALGGVVVSGRTLAWKHDDVTEVIAECPPGLTRFNDLAVDPDGRIYVGSIDMQLAGSPPRRIPGFLHRFDLDGSEHVIGEGLVVSNGMQTSPDGTLLYHGDTGARTVWQYDRGVDGSLTNKRPLIQWDDAGPDGMALAEDGTLFVVLVWGDEGQIAVVSPGGRELDRIPVPGPATSLCFGGEDLQTLYIVTGGPHDGDGRTAGVFAERMPVAGLPVPPVRVTPAGH